MTDEPVGRLADGRPDRCPVYRWPGDEDFDRPQWPEAAGQRVRWQSVIDSHALPAATPGRCRECGQPWPCWPLFEAREQLARWSGS